MFDAHEIFSPDFLAKLNAGNRMALRSEMIAIVTSSSIKEKPTLRPFWSSWKSIRRSLSISVESLI